MEERVKSIKIIEKTKQPKQPGPMDIKHTAHMAKIVISLALVMILAFSSAIFAFASVSQTQAEDAALEAVELKRDEVDLVSSKSRNEEGQLYYDVEIYIKSFNSYTLYKVTVKASDGSVTNQSVDIADKLPQQGGNNKNEITAEEAKQIAFKDCGVSGDRAKDVTAVRKYKNLSPVYDIKFTVDETAYHYEIDAYSGSILTRASGAQAENPGNSINVLEILMSFIKTIITWIFNIFNF